MPSFEETVSANINAAWPSVVAVQSAYYAIHGKYCQCLWSHSSPPENGNPASPDNLLSVPVHQTDNWQTSGAAAILGDTPRIRARIDIYSGPSGDGFALTAQYSLSGTIRSMTKSYGAENWDQAWHNEEVAE